MPSYPRDLPNFYLLRKGNSQNYTYPKKIWEPKSVPLRNRIEHAKKLQQALEKALENYQQQKL
jgi:hypothetical protein